MLSIVFVTLLGGVLAGQALAANPKTLEVSTGGKASGYVYSNNVSGIQCGFDEFASFEECKSGYVKGTEVRLIAAWNGNAGVDWTGCDEVAGPNGEECVVAMSEAKYVTAVFGARRLKVLPTGSGYVYSNNVSGIQCGSGDYSSYEECKSGYATGTVVRLIAAWGGSVVSWTGCDEVAGPNGEECVVAMNTARKVSAAFE
jgi:hypothetical protein